MCTHSQPILRLNHNSSSCQSQGRTGCLLLLLEQYVKTQRATHLLPLSPRIPSLSLTLSCFSFFHHFFHFFFFFSTVGFAVAAVNFPSFNLLNAPIQTESVCVWACVFAHVLLYVHTSHRWHGAHTDRLCKRCEQIYILRERDCPFYLYVYILHFFGFLITIQIVWWIIYGCNVCECNGRGGRLSSLNSVNACTHVATRKHIKIPFDSGIKEIILQGPWKRWELVLQREEGGVCLCVCVCLCVLGVGGWGGQESEQMADIATAPPPLLFLSPPFSSWQLSGSWSRGN